MKRQIFLLLILLQLCIKSISQQVNCIKQIQSPEGQPVSCTSTSTLDRPINVTSTFKCLKNTNWVGVDDWSAYIVKGSGKYIVYDLKQQPNCFLSGPSSGKWKAGQTFDFTAKCTILSFQLQKGDAVYMDVFIYPTHKTECSYVIPIPGYSQESELKSADIYHLRNQALQIQEAKKREQNYYQ